MPAPIAPTIQGDVVVFDVATGERKLILDGPTVTARRTAAVSLLAAQTLAPNTDGPLLIVGAGAQGRAHLEAFAQGLPLSQVFIASRGAASANALAGYARSLGLQAQRCRGSGCGARRLPAGGDLHAGERGGAAGASAGRCVHRRGRRVHAAHGGTGPRSMPALRDPGKDRGRYAAGRSRSRRPAAGGAGCADVRHAARRARQWESRGRRGARAFQELRLGGMGPGRGADGAAVRDRHAGLDPASTWSERHVDAGSSPA